MGTDLQNVDALIFDMDGTLWNATESYAKIWNETCACFGMKTHFVGSDLLQYMGMGIEEIVGHLLGDNTPADMPQFMTVLYHLEDKLMPTLGGVLFPGVKEGLERLSKRYRLFMLSNCSKRGLVNFTTFTGTTHLFEGLLSQGERPASKNENLRHLIDSYSLAGPVYVGDTQGDCDQAHLAGVPFFFAAYGFGQCADADWLASSFDEMVEILMASPVYTKKTEKEI